MKWRVLTDCFKLHATLTFKNSVIGNYYYHCSTYVVVANKGLHQTEFTNPPMYKTKNFITLSLLNIIFYPHLSLLFLPFLALLDMMVFTQVVCRVEQKQCCRLNSKPIKVLISVCNTAPKFLSSSCSITDMYCRSQTTATEM